MSGNHNHHTKFRYFIQSFEAKKLKKRSLTSRMADKLTWYFGSAGFFFLNVIVFIVWIVINNGAISWISVFDPYPHVFLITFVSLEAIILTTVVLMSQRRQSNIDVIREELQLQVELITEREITKILELLIMILEKQGVTLKDEELDEMLKQIDTSYIERKLTHQLLGDEKKAL